jgi:hypothetical protein
MMARKVNANWAAVDAVGFRWRKCALTPRRWFMLECNVAHCASEYAYPEFVESMNAEMLAAHNDSALKYARKGRRHDLAMAEAIERRPEVKAAIEAAALAAITPQPEAPLTRKTGRL